ncbi:TetR family transcriptional regulator [Allosaccharopolyspora coralli]|uniref:TetR family transcriptional regulator n=1 Tax=Allosaccharopolyspora coralli TaxID=2665642 RepID=A0A5Q3QFS2_9PSEU|nr:TetR family transcriptional regulator [Allosaccharopolyspora coralli]
MNQTERSPRARLLDAAEELLLRSGCDAVSVRAINAEAGMNPAAVHYHFGSKDALIAALLEARLTPLWQDELAELAARRDAGRPPATAELVDVVLGPLRRLVEHPRGRLHLHLLARLVLGRRDVGWTSRWFRIEPWVDLLCSARPGLTESQARERLMLAFDLTLHVVGTPAADTPRENPTGLEALRTFVAAGLEAAP